LWRYVSYYIFEKTKNIPAVLTLRIFIVLNFPSIHISGVF
jgi:hypothetical protein